MRPFTENNRIDSGPAHTRKPVQLTLAVGVSLVTHLALAIALVQANNPKPLSASLPSQSSVSLRLSTPPPIVHEPTGSSKQHDSQALLSSAGRSTHKLPQAIPASTPEPLPEPQLEPEPKPEPEPQLEPEPKPEPEPAIPAATEPVLEPEPVAQPESLPQVLPEREPQPKTQPEPGHISELAQTASLTPHEDSTKDDMSSDTRAFKPSNASELATTEQKELREQLYNTYLTALMQELRRSFEYPRGALRRRQEGRVQIALRVEPDGSIARVTLDSSSGYSLLDESALAMVARISGLPALPEEAGHQGLAVSVPIDFTLN